MTRMLATRARDLVLLLFGIGTLVFIMVHLIPGGPAIAILGPNATNEQIAKLSAKLGLDAPVLSQYWHWLASAVQGKLGTSISYQAPVLNVIADHVVPSALLAGIVTAGSLAIALPLGGSAGMHPERRWARAVRSVSVVGVAVPNFWLALGLIYLFAVSIRVFPTSGYVSLSQSVTSFASHMVLPVIVLAAGQVPLYLRTFYEGVTEEAQRRYVRTARAKGVSETRLLFRDVLPNAILPSLTVVGTSIGNLIGGIIIVENIFVIPGIGTLIYQAIENRDYPLVEGLTLFITVVYVAINLVIDVVHLYLDPRIRLS